MYTQTHARTAWPSISKTYLYLPEGKQARKFEIEGFYGGDDKKGHGIFVGTAV